MKWNLKEDSSPLTIFGRWFGMIVKRHARFGNTYDGYIRVSVSWKFRLRVKHFSFYFRARAIFFFFLHKVFFFFLFPFCDGKERTYKCTFSRNLLGRRTTSIFIYTRATYDTLLSKKRLRAFYSFGDRCKHRFLFCREISWKQGLVENRRLLCNNLI